MTKVASKNVNHMLTGIGMNKKIRKPSMLYCIKKENKEDNKDENYSGVIDEEQLEQMDDKTIAEIINKSIDAIPDCLMTLFTNNEFIDTLVENLYSEIYNTYNKSKKIELFRVLNSYVFNSLGNDIFNEKINLVKEPIDGEFCYIDQGDVYFYKDAFVNNCGITLLTIYIKALIKYLIIKVTDGAYMMELDPKLLTKKALVYYENLQSSYLIGSWSNLLDKDNKKYAYQPIVFDSNYLAEKINLYYIKHIYNHFKHIDEEIDSFINYQMIYKNSLPKMVQERKELIKKANENIINSLKTEEVNYDKYIKRTAMDLSKFTDQEFYELFNISYSNGLNEYEDPTLGDRLSNVCNELLNRELKDYDTSKLDLPTYSTNYDLKTGNVLFISNYKDKTKNKVFEINGSGDALAIVLDDLIIICKNNGFFKFNSKKEKNDYFYMLKWKKIKDILGYDNFDKEIINDGLNIINNKSSELLSNLNDKINAAIKVSEFLPHNRSMIIYDSKQALYDYHEFKNCHTKEEMTQTFNDIVQLDLHDNFKKYEKEIKEKLDKEKLDKEKSDTKKPLDTKGGRK